MDLENQIRNKSGRTFSSLVLDPNKGREYLNSLYPSEFEYYACAFELCDENNQRIEYFSFPVLPMSIQESKNSIANIKKTYGGITITNSATFVPFQISLSGDFGRKFRRVDFKQIQKIEGKIDSTKTKEVTNENGEKEQMMFGELSEVKSKPIFSSDYKTGYASVKILESMLNKAQGWDVARKPLRLFFYNLSLNSNHLVEPNSIVISQSKDRNMIWQYSIQLMAVAPARYIFSDFKTTSLKELRSYNKKHVRMTQQSNIINEMLKNVISGMTPTESLMNQFKNYKSYGQQSAFKFLKQVTDNPLETITSVNNRQII